MFNKIITNISESLISWVAVLFAEKESEGLVLKQRDQERPDVITSYWIKSRPVSSNAKVVV